MADNQWKTGLLAWLLVLLSVGSLCIVGLFVWAVGQRKGGGFSFADKSAYVKCNGLDRVGQRNLGSIPSTYKLADKRYTCRGFRGNTPQRVTQISYTFIADSRAAQPKGTLDGYLSAELAKSDWISPGVETINGFTTSLHLTQEPLIGLSYEVTPSRNQIFQIDLFARDAWLPQTPNARAPHNLIIKNATIQEYVADLTAMKPTFVPVGYTSWHQLSYSDGDEFDTRNLTSVIFTLTGGTGDVEPEVDLTEASADQPCGNNECAEVGKNREGGPIYSSADGNAIYSQLGDTFVMIDHLANRFSKPIVDRAAGLAVLESMQANK